jgi:hypothetical protein
MKKSLCAVLFVSVILGFVGNGWCIYYDPYTPVASWEECLFIKAPTQKEIFLLDTLTFSAYAIGGWLNNQAQRIDRDKAPLNPTDLIMEVYEYDGSSLVGEPLYFFQGVYHPDEYKWTVEGSFPVAGLPKRFIVVPIIEHKLRPDSENKYSIRAGLSYYNDLHTTLYTIRDIFDVPVFRILYDGSTYVYNSLFVNGASSWGTAPFVLGQDVLNRGMVITDKAEANQKNIYFGWNVGEVHEYAEIFALQEGIAWKNLVLNPHGGNLGIGYNNPLHLIDTGGAYCNGFTWVNASSRELKQDFRPISTVEAKAVLSRLEPLEYAYKADPSEKTLGFIAEDVPDLVATNDRKSVNPMDMIAVLVKVVQDQQRELKRQGEEIERLKARTLMGAK